MASPRAGTIMARGRLGVLAKGSPASETRMMLRSCLFASLFVLVASEARAQQVDPPPPAPPAVAPAPKPYRDDVTDGVLMAYAMGGVLTLPGIVAIGGSLSAFPEGQRDSEYFFGLMT